MTEPSSRTGIPCSSRDSALQMVQSFTSPVFADLSGCLPVWPTHASVRKGMPVPSMPRYRGMPVEQEHRGGSVSTRSASAISFPRAFCRSLHLLGVYGHPGQFHQQLTSFLETYQSAHGPGHAREGRRERGVFYAQVLIARTKAVTAAGAVIVGALQT